MAARPAPGPVDLVPPVGVDARPGFRSARSPDQRAVSLTTRPYPRCQFGPGEPLLHAPGGAMTDGFGKRRAPFWYHLDAIWGVIFSFLVHFWQMCVEVKNVGFAKGFSQFYTKWPPHRPQKQ